MSTSPPSLASQATEAANPTTQARVQMAMCKAAQDISSEPDTTPNHTTRITLATRVANQPAYFTQPFTSMVCAEGITSASSDADISNMVSAVWNTIAGQTPVPPPGVV